MSGFGKRRAFTLLELLVSVAIFSGVIILSLGAFAHSANSSLKSTAVREKTEAARTIVDRIGADIKYVYTGENNDSDFNVTPRECGNVQGVLALGLHYTSSCLAMLLQYPGVDENDLTLKVYKDFIGTSGEPSIGLVEYSECEIDDLNKNLNCIGTGGPSNLISDRFMVDNLLIFSGMTPIEARDAMPDQKTPILGVEVTVKPVNSGTCPNPGERPNPCYTIKTSFVPGP